MIAPTERRHAPKGDERRAALLASLADQLQDSSLDSINIADISRRAGVTRSAFYFYFESKALAVAALMEELYDESLAAAALLVGEGEPAANIEATIRGLFEARAPVPSDARRPRDEHRRPRDVGVRPGLVRAPRRGDDHR